MDLSRWGVAVLGFGFVCAFAATRPEDIGPKFGKAYAVLFNDMDLVKKGQFGLSRAPVYHQSILGNRKMNSSQEALLDMKKQAAKEGWIVVEGFEETNPTKANRFHKAFELIWLTTVFSAGKVPEKTPKFITDKSLPTQIWHGVQSSTDGTFRTKSENFSVYAQRIRFEHTECISCHSGAKVGDTAGLAVIAVRKN